jgi:hypothetical protein
LLSNLAAYSLNKETDEKRKEGRSKYEVIRSKTKTEAHVSKTGQKAAQNTEG